MTHPPPTEVDYKNTIEILSFLRNLYNVIQACLIALERSYYCKHVDLFSLLRFVVEYSSSDVNQFLHLQLHHFSLFGPTSCNESRDTLA